jgi:hypothetical protein
MTPNLYAKLLTILTGRSLTPGPGDFALVDQADGIGPRIASWNAGKLGARPTQLELDAVTDAQADAALKDVQATDIDADLLIQAVAQLDYEERQKLTVINGQTLRTAAQCKARVKAIYRSLL